MKKLKKWMFSPKGTLAVFGAAIVLLLLSSVGGARAAIEEYSRVHNTEIQTQHIGVSLVEEGAQKPVKSGESWDDETNIGDDATFDQLGSGFLELPNIEASGAKVGKTYTENLKVVNSGEIDQYVRVTIYKWWEKDGVKQTDLYPGYIELGLADGWVVDQNASTYERTVLYYTDGPLKGTESSTDAPTEKDVVKSIRINPEVSHIVEQAGSDNVFSYEGCEFKIQVDVDAVQTHNAKDAILSAWGKTVTVNDGSLSGIK